MWMYAAVPAALAIALQDAPLWAALLALAGCVFCYHLSYQFLARRAELDPLTDSAGAPLEPTTPVSQQP